MLAHSRTVFPQVFAVLPALLCLGATAGAADVSWSGGEMTWSQPDGDSFGVDTYTSGLDVLFTDTGAGSVAISGTLTPGSTTFETSTNYVFTGGDLAGGAVELTTTNDATISFQEYTGSLGFNSLTVRGGDFEYKTFALSGGESVSVGTGPVTLDGGEFSFRIDTTGVSLLNDFVVTANGGTIDADRSTGNPTVGYTGAFQVAGDLLLRSGGGGNGEERIDIQGGVTLQNDLHIPALGFSNGCHPVISGDIGEDASARQLTLSFTAGNRTNVPFNIRGTSNTWSGGTVIAEGTSRIDVAEGSALGVGDVLVQEDSVHDDFAELTLRGKDNIADAATLTVETGAMVELAFANESAGVWDDSDMSLSGLMLGTTPVTGLVSATTYPDFFTGDGEIYVIPEPATLALLAAGACGVFARGRRRRRC